MFCIQKKKSEENKVSRLKNVIKKKLCLTEYFHFLIRKNKNKEKLGKEQGEIISDHVISDTGKNWKYSYFSDNVL